MVGEGVAVGTEDDASTEVGEVIPGPGLVEDVELQPSISTVASVKKSSTSLFILTDPAGRLSQQLYPFYLVYLKGKYTCEHNRRYLKPISFPA